MANQNFVVHNGLTVGPLTIDAETGSIDTTGAISIGGNIGVSAIFKGDSSISIDDTGSGSFIATTLDGTVRQIQNATVATFTSNIMSSGNVTAPYYFGNGSQLIGVTSGSIFTGNVQGGLAQFAALNGTIIGNATAVAGSFTTVTASSVTKSGTSNVGNIGQTDNRYHTLHAKASSAQYADLAEVYESDASYEAGTVVHFGGEKEVSQCDIDHCRKVAGVVSTNPAYLMNGGFTAENIAVVALTGRVPTKVTGTVAKGDMMVSDGTGRARAEADPKVGAVIGKALEASEGDAVIEVVVGKH